MITLEQLKSFCSTDETRAVLAKPWFRNGFTWASDGRIMVRIPGQVPEIGDNPQAPDAWMHWHKHAPDVPDGAEWIPLPSDIPPVEMEVCVCCDDGIHDCNCGHSHVCATCEGLGKVHGTVHGMDVEDRVLSEFYLAKIAALPNPMLFLGTDHVKPVMFRFDGGEGLLMPMLKKVP